MGWSFRRPFAAALLCVGALGLLCLRPGGRRPPFRLSFVANATRLRPDGVCAEELFVVVNSAPGNAQRRLAIRETWGHPDVLRPLGVGLAFGVGAAAEEGAQRLVHWEAETFGDLLQWPRTDAYAALPRKVLHLLAAARDACRPRLLLKVDDDVFVNPFALDGLLREEARSGLVDDGSLRCLVWEGMSVVRSDLSKWSVSRTLHPDDVYPTYCSGAAYILPARTLDLLLAAHRDDPDVALPVEDVYVTGVLAGRSGVLHRQIGHRYAFRSVREEDVAAGRTVFAHLGTDVEDRTRSLWQAVQRNDRRKSRETFSSPPETSSVTSRVTSASA